MCESGGLGKLLCNTSYPSQHSVLNRKGGDDAAGAAFTKEESSYVSQERRRVL